jgi:hypothetical protein
MIPLLLFLHVLGFLLWMGGAFAVMVTSIAARKEDRSVLGPLVRLQASITGTMVGPGAGVTVATGLILAFKMFGTAQPAPSGWIMIMQAAGLLAGIITLAFAIPAASRLRRMDPLGPQAQVFDALRSRQRIVGSLSGVLALIALLGGVMARFG